MQPKTSSHAQWATSRAAARLGGLAFASAVRSEREFEQDTDHFVFQLSPWSNAIRFDWGKVVRLVLLACYFVACGPQPSGGDDDGAGGHDTSGSDGGGAASASSSTSGSGAGGPDGPSLPTKVTLTTNNEILDRTWTFTYELRPDGRPDVAHVSMKYSNPSPYEDQEGTVRFYYDVIVEPCSPPPSVLHMLHVDPLMVFNLGGCPSTVVENDGTPTDYTYSGGVITSASNDDPYEGAATVDSAGGTVLGLQHDSALGTTVLQYTADGADIVVAGHYDPKPQQVGAPDPAPYSVDGRVELDAFGRRLRVVAASSLDYEYEP